MRAPALADAEGAQGLLSSSHDAAGGAEESMPRKRSARAVVMKAAEGAPLRPSQLLHLTGVKTLVAMWIVLHHMAPRDPESAVSAFTMRVDVAVELFMLLSGFMTHHAYGDKDVSRSAGSLLSFYVRRLARIVITTQVSMLCSLFWWWFGGRSVLTATTVGCLTFLKPWYDPTPDCPNAPSWFVAAVIPAWLLYPIVTRHVVLRASETESSRRLSFLAVGFWLLSIGPQLACAITQSSWLTWEQVKLTWFWPASQLGDFALGVCVAAFAKKAPPTKIAGAVADVLCVFLLMVCFFCPTAETPEYWQGPIFRPGHYMAWDAFSGRVSAPVLAAWIYCSCSGTSYVGQFMGSSVFVTLGAYTLEVYLFQTPLHDLFMWTKNIFWLPQESAEVFMLYLFVLWLISAAFVDLLAAFADKWLKRQTADWETKPLAHFCGRHDIAYMSVEDGD